MIVGAEFEAITYNELLPVLLGPDAIAAYTGYKAGRESRGSATSSRPPRSGWATRC